jgi:hypothetical protein
MHAPVTPITIPSFTLLNYGISVTTPIISFPWWMDIILAGPVFGAVVMAIFCVIWQIGNLFEGAGYAALELDEGFIKEAFIDLEKEGSIIEKIGSIAMFSFLWLSVLSILYFIFNFLVLPFTEHLPVIVFGPVAVYFLLSACFFFVFTSFNIVRVFITASPIEIFCEVFSLKYKPKITIAR